MMVTPNLPKFFAAIDDSEQVGAIQKAQKIKNVRGDYGVKLNLDLILKESSIISKIAAITGRPVFSDIKMMNGKRTMRELVKAVATEGAIMINAYALADYLIKGAIEEAKERGIIVLGVTVTTHYDDDYCIKYFGKNLVDTVEMLAQAALDNGFHGYIVPGTTLSALSGKPGIKFSSSIRPSWFQDKKTNDQKQDAEPAVAIKSGANVICCGSPIFKSPDPAEALEKILKEIEEANL